jgi:ATP-binding cassette subfamily C protein LapB
VTATHQKYDPLLESIVIFARRYHRPVSVEALISGLPVKKGAAGPELFAIESSKGLFSRVAKRAGFASKLTKRSLDDLSDLLLPCILVLHDRKACILEKVDRERGMAKIILPEVDEGEEWIDMDKLKEQYLGFAFLLKREYQKVEREQKLSGVKQGHWFWGTLSRSFGIYGSVILASVMVNMFVLATPMFTMNVYDRVVPNNATETLWVLAIGVAIIYVFDTMLRFIRNYLLEIAGKKSDIIMSSIIYEQVMNLKMNQWPKSVGAFANRLTQFESVRNFLTASTILALVDLPFSLLFLFVIGYISTPVVFVPIAAMVLLLIHAVFLIKPLRQSVEKVFAASAQKHSMLVESLSSVKTIKTLGASQNSQWIWEEATGDIANNSLHSRQLSSSIAVVTNLLVQMNMVGIVIVGFYQITNLELSMGGLIACVILGSRSIAPISQLSSLIINYQQTKTAYDSLNQLMALDVERPEGKAFVRRPMFHGSIYFKNVSFNYPEAETAALAGFTLKINPGEHVGIIGRVGSGKTTLNSLVMGLYPVTSGSLTIDDIDINQIDPADLRRSIAYLSQDIELMQGTIRDNIVLKDPQADDEMILQASHVAGVDLFVNLLPKGFDTIIGERGLMLSGGQRQCIALARTVLMGEPIVILDEPTNSMDNTTESIIRRRLYDYTRDKTLIMTTHKTAMLDLVERLVVIDNGRVLMDGPKDDVIEKLKERSNVT